jgi:hypothetical protein
MLEHIEDENTYKKSELIVLAYQSAFLCYPTKEEVELLLSVDFKRCLEIMLLMRQSPNKIRNPKGFIQRAIKEQWNATSLPRKMDRRRLSIDERMNNSERKSPPFTFYNWLED